ncbi:MAG: hypothetical protein AB7S26_38425 [Sandaracinaceae bacterium]
MTKLALSPFVVALALASPSLASAQAGIRVHEIEGVRIDGALSEWRAATFTPVGSGPDASMRFALGHDGAGLYVAAQVTDDRLVRTSDRGTREDAVILTLASGRRVVDVYLFAGVRGSAASVGVASSFGGRPRALSGAQIVEGPSQGGYAVEAFIPFRAFPDPRRWDTARASIRLRDVDSEAHPEAEAEPSLVDVDARHLDRLIPLLPSGGAAGALEAFLAERGIGAARPRFDLRGNAVGDGQPERVFVVDRYVVLTGPGVPGGGYAYHQLSIDSAGDVRSAQLRDLTGDGHAELVLVVRQRNAQGERDLWQVIALSGERIRELFGIEVRKAIGAGFVEARVTIQRARRGAPEIEVSAHRAEGLDRASFRETPAGDAEPILLPWGPVAARRYRWDGQRFARTTERANPRYEEEPPPSATRPTATQMEEAPSEPVPPSHEDLLAEFRRQRGIRRGARPRFTLRANLAGDRAEETALVYGRDLVAVGPGIQRGTSWFHYEIPAPNDADVLDVRAADVTGDGRAELLFRLRQQVGDVEREVLLVHQIAGSNFPRMLQVEVARRRGQDSVVNEVSTDRGALRIAPGRARGWGADDWPFARNTDDPVEPLLLPWSDRAVRYRARGGRLVR